jgi:rhodanese-related sulfurtransferase
MNTNSTLLFVVCILAIIGLSRPVCADNDQFLPDLKDIVVAGPYCGIYSLCACLDAFGKKPLPQELLTPDYVGSYRGSTAEELVKAAEKQGLYGKCYANMSWRRLQEIKEPMILHFRGSNNSQFNHWVAFLGMTGKHGRIVDIPHELAHLTMAEILAQWDGVAVILSEKPIQDESVWKARRDYLFAVVFIFGFVFLYKTIYWSPDKEPSAAPTRLLCLKRYFTQTASLLGLCGFLAIAYHALSSIGFLKNPSAVAEVSRRYYAVDVPEINVTEMQKITEQKSAIIYDCRHHRDFERGTLPNAMSLPINSNLTERKKILQGISKEHKIVVYCQSSSCGFADEVAAFLEFNGYKNISIYRGGYREWAAQNQKTIQP